MDPGSPEREDFPTGTSAAAASGRDDDRRAQPRHPGPDGRRPAREDGVPARPVQRRLRARRPRLARRRRRGRPAVGGGRQLLQGLHLHHARRAGPRRGPRCRAPDRLGAGRGGQPPALRGRVAHRGGRDAAAGRGPDGRRHPAGLAQPGRRAGGRRRRRRCWCGGPGPGPRWRTSAIRRSPTTSCASGRGAPRCTPRAARSTSCCARRRSLDQGALRKFTPPARARTDEDEAEMWRLLRDRRADAHVQRPRAVDPRAEAGRGHLERALRPAGAGQHDGAAARRGGARPPRLRGRRAGLQRASRPRSTGCGRARAGSRWAPTPTSCWSTRGAQRTLRSEDVLSKAGWTPFDGRTVRGRVVLTLPARDGGRRGGPAARRADRPLRPRAGRHDRLTLAFADGRTYRPYAAAR